MTRAYISVGSNIEPAKNIRAAVLALAKEVRLLALSTIYETAPEHGRNQANFYNGVALIETERSPDDLKFNVLRPLEARLGRQRTDDKNASRPIDLDILLYGDLVMDTAALTIPDPEIATRPVLAIPLCELAPHLVPPGMKAPVSSLSHALPRAAMKPLHGYTEQLRKRLGDGF